MKNQPSLQTHTFQLWLHEPDSDAPSRLALRNIKTGECQEFASTDAMLRHLGTQLCQSTALEHTSVHNHASG